MAFSYLGAAWRSIRTNKGFTTVHIIGLTAGICACLTIYTLTSYELGFDSFHPDKDRIYRLGARITEHGEEDYGEDVPPPTAATLRREIPGIESAARYYTYNTGDTNAILTDGDYFRIFPYEWLVGNPATALTGPFSVVLTESRARRYFGPGNPAQWIGRTIPYPDSLIAHVTGIVRDWPGNTDFPYTDLLALSSISGSPALGRHFHPDSWAIPPRRNPWARTLIKLSPQTDPERIAAQLPAFINRHLAQDSMLQLLHFALVLQPLGDIHFNTTYSHDGSRKAHLPILYGLMGAATFILLLAIVNFINLSTAQSLRRARETNIRRILGSSRRQLALQFLTETAIITTLAALLAAFLVYPVLHLFQSWLPEGLHPFDGPALLFLLATIVATTLLAGLYPARVLSAPTAPSHRYTVRKTLIVFQFTISLLFIIGSFVYAKQLHFMLNADPGFNHDAVITIGNFNASPEQMKRFSRQTQQLPGIASITLQGHAPAGNAIIEIPIRLENQKDKDDLVSLQAADTGFLRFYHIPLLAGRNIRAGDSAHETIINDTYRRVLGFKTPVKALGHLLTWNNQSFSIVGVIEDFHAASFHDPVYPLLIAPLPNLRKSIAFRLTPGVNTTEVFKQLKGIWASDFPGATFEYHFLDESITALYAGEIRFATLVHAATILAIGISCMGLLGLILFVVEKKKKEISIRKVLGAGVADIVWLLNKEFAGLIAIALLIAAPVAGYTLHRWLQNYAYRTSISWWVFAGAGLTALTIAMLTITYRVIRAARTNPIDNLRNQ